MKQIHHSTLTGQPCGRQVNIIKIAEVNINTAIENQRDSEKAETSNQKQFKRRLEEMKKKLAAAEGQFQPIAHP